MLSHLGVRLGDRGATLGLCWASWGHLGPMLGHLGAILGLCLAILGPSWAYVWPMLGHLGPSWSHRGPMLGHLGAHLGPFWGYLGAGGTPRKVYVRFMLIFSKSKKHCKLRRFLGTEHGRRQAPLTGRGRCPSTGPAGPICSCIGRYHTIPYSWSAAKESAGQSKMLQTLKWRCKKKIRMQFFQGMRMMQSGYTVKRYSQLPKTITLSIMRMRSL